MDLAAADLTGPYRLALTEPEEWPGEVSVQGTSIVGTLHTATGAVVQISGDTRDWAAGFDVGRIDRISGISLRGQMTMYVGSGRLRIEFFNNRVWKARLTDRHNNETDVRVECSPLLHAFVNGLLRHR